MDLYLCPKLAASMEWLKPRTKKKRNVIQSVRFIGKIQETPHKVRRLKQTHSQKIPYIFLIDHVEIVD